MTVPTFESAAKKVARYLLWQEIVHAVRPVAFDAVRSRRRELRIAVLAGPDGGDIGMLRAMLGITPPEVFAIDCDARAASSSEAVHPGFSVAVGDCFAMLRKEPRRSFDAIALDFYGPASPETLRGLAQITPWLRHGGVLAAAHSYGREPWWRGVEERLLRDHGCRRPSDGRFPEKSLASLGAEVRAQITGVSVMVGAPTSETAEPFLNLQYQSKREGGAGTPMLWSMWKVHRAAGKRRPDPMRLDWHAMPFLCVPGGRVAGMMLREMTTTGPWGDAPAGLVALGLGISARTVAAQRAHRTMGTYDPERTELDRWLGRRSGGTWPEAWWRTAAGEAAE